MTSHHSRPVLPRGGCSGCLIEACNGGTGGSTDVGRDCEVCPKRSACKRRTIVATGVDRPAEVYSCRQVGSGIESRSAGAAHADPGIRFADAGTAQDPYR